LEFDKKNACSSKSKTLDLESLQGMIGIIYWTVAVAAEQ
jgi:hypothetical protein